MFAAYVTVTILASVFNGIAAVTYLTKTYRSTRHPGLDKVITSLNRLLAGWANYCVSRGHARMDWRAVGLMV